MIKKEFTVKDPSGFHARPATALVQEASRHNCDVNIIANGTSVNAKSIMGVMSLGIKANETFEIEAEQEEVIAQIGSILEENGIV